MRQLHLHDPGVRAAHRLRPVTNQQHRHRAHLVGDHRPGHRLGRRPPDPLHRAAWASNATGNRQAYFQVTTGANNPGGAGLTTAFGAVAGLTDGTGNPTRFTLAALCPYLYLLDYLEVYAYQNSGGALNTAACSWQVTLESLGP